jgi:hypothetical protein
MELLAEYEVDCPALPLVEVARAVPRATMLVEMVPNADTHSPFVVTVTEGSSDAVAAELDAAAFVGELTTLGAADADARFQVIPAVGMEDRLGDHVDDVDGLRALARVDATFERIAVTPEGWHYTARFADRDAFDAVREFWQREGQPFRLHRLTCADSDDGDDAGLTDRQREALVAAREMGYFAVPRRATLAEVADRLDISAASLSERLRRAQAHLVDAHVESPARRDELKGPHD